MSRTKNEISDMVPLNELQKEITAIFDKIEQEHGLAKNEYLAMVALWDNGSMPMKSLDEFIDIKPYKRTSFYNDLVKKGWIHKERPANDERTVIITYNEEKANEKQAIIETACGEIKGNMANLTKHFEQVMNICK